MLAHATDFCSGIYGPVAQRAKLIARRENGLLNLTVPKQAQIKTFQIVLFLLIILNVQFL